jgi:hypothetical protein
MLEAVPMEFDQVPTVRGISLQWKVEVESPDYNCLRSSKWLACDGPGAAQATRASPGVEALVCVIDGKLWPTNNYRMALLDQGRHDILLVLPTRWVACLYSARWLSSMADMKGCG